MSKSERRPQIPQYVIDAKSLLVTVCKPAGCDNLMESGRTIRCIAKESKEIAGDFAVNGKCETGRAGNKRKIVMLPAS